MKLHEYQAKDILRHQGVATPKGGVAAVPQEASGIAAALGGPVAVKAQVHAGGRGKAGGIILAQTPAEAGTAASKLLGSRLVTPQTGKDGLPVGHVLVEAATAVNEELYLGIAMDSRSARPVAMASRAGGMDIETVAAQSPERVVRIAIDPVLGLRPYQARQLASALGLGPDFVRQFTDIALGLYRAFVEKDCLLAEINPLALTPGGSLLALDAKLDIDDNALYRHPELAELRDVSQEDPAEVAAKEGDVSNYIRLEGDIACLVNGAGLAMATMDIIKHYGGEPANFLDIGGGTREDRVVSALRAAAQPGVRAILINIFGGITRVDIIAKGIVQAHATGLIRVPLVLRLAGTNVEEGKRILAESGIPYVEGGDLAEAAQMAVRKTIR